MFGDYFAARGIRTDGGRYEAGLPFITPSLTAAFVVLLGMVLAIGINLCLMAYYEVARLPLPYVASVAADAGPGIICAVGVACLTSTAGGGNPFGMKVLSGTRAVRPGRPP